MEAFSFNRVRPAEFLASRFGSDVTGVAMLGQGEWSHAYCFRRAGADYVIRFSALVEDFSKDHLAMQFSSSNLPIPRITEVGEAFGGYYAISERAFGGFLDDLGAAEMRAILPGLFTVLDAMRLADVSGSTGYGMWDARGDGEYRSWREFLLDVGNDRPTRRTHGWRAQLTASPQGEKAFREGFNALELLVDQCPEARHLVHSDLLNRNVLVGENQICSVFDWGCGMYGDFLYDVAWFSFWSARFPAMSDIDVRQEALNHYARTGVAVSNFAERVRACELHIGLTHIAYHAFKRRWDDLHDTARRTLEVAAR